MDSNWTQITKLVNYLSKEWSQRSVGAYKEIIMSGVFLWILEALSCLSSRKRYIVKTSQSFGHSDLLDEFILLIYFCLR